MQHYRLERSILEFYDDVRGSLRNWRHCKQHPELATMLVCRRVWRVYMEFIWSFRAFSSQFAVWIVSYARPTIIHGCFIEITFAGSLGRYLNTRPSGLMFKQLPLDPANVNAWKAMGDPYILLNLGPVRWNIKKKMWAFKIYLYFLLPPSIFIKTVANDIFIITVFF